MVQLTRRNLILAKIETTYGTDPTPTTASNAVEVMDLKMKRVKEPVERNFNHESLMTKPSLLGAEFYEISFKTEIVLTGTAGVAPRVGPLLRACGMSETFITGGSPSVKYRDRSTSFESCTIWAYIGGRLFKAVGCFGTLKMNLEAGKTAILEFTMQGIVGAAISITSMPTDAVYDTVAGSVPLCKAGTFSYNSKTTLCTNMLEFDLGNTISRRECLSATYVVEGFEITDRKPKMTINPESQVFTSYDFFGDALTNRRAVSYAVSSAFTFTVTKFNPYSPEYEDVEGILHDKIEGEVAEDTSLGYSFELQYSG